MGEHLHKGHNRVLDKWEADKFWSVKITMKTQPTQTADKGTEQWQIAGEYITDSEGSARFRVMGQAPYNTAWMERAVQAVNQHEALVNALKDCKTVGINDGPVTPGKIGQTAAERLHEINIIIDDALKALESEGEA